MIFVKVSFLFYVMTYVVSKWFPAFLIWYRVKLINIVRDTICSSTLLDSQTFAHVDEDAHHALQLHNSYYSFSELSTGQILPPFSVERTMPTYGMNTHIHTRSSTTYPINENNWVELCQLGVNYNERRTIGKQIFRDLVKNDLRRMKARQRMARHDEGQQVHKKFSQSFLFSPLITVYTCCSLFAVHGPNISKTVCALNFESQKKKQIRKYCCLYYSTVAVYFMPCTVEFRW